MVNGISTLVLPLRFFIVLIGICCVDGNNSCSVVNNHTGAMVCCPSPSDAITLQEGCEQLLPIVSLPLTPGAWSKEVFNQAQFNFSKKIPSVEEDKRKCCCKENAELVLSGVAITDTGERATVIQHSAGYVQPLFVKMCNMVACQTEGSTSCAQNWIAKEVYTEDPSHKGFMHLRKIIVPGGCICIKLEETRLKNLKDLSTKYTKELKDFVVTKLPGSVTGVSDSAPFSETIDNSNLTILFPNDKEVKSSHFNDEDFQIPAISLADKNQFFSDIEGGGGLKDLYNLYIALNNSENFFQGNESSLYGHEFTNFTLPRPENEKVSNITRNNSLSVDYLNRFGDLPGLSSYLTNGQYPFATDGVPSIKESNSDRVNQQPSLEKLLSFPKTGFLNPDLLNSYNSFMENYLKINLLNRSLGQMTARGVIENILNNIPGDKQIYALEIYERVMKTEMEYLRLTKEIFERILHYNVNLSSNKASSTANTSAQENIPDIMKPGGINPISTSSPVSVSTSAGPARGDQIPNSTENALTNLIESLLSGDKISQSQGSVFKDKIEPLFEVSLSPVSIPEEGVSSLALLGSPSPIISRVRIEDMLDEQLLSAFATFLFNEAWMESSCMIPKSINQSHSELYFLPSLIKENFDIKAKGKLEINKFAGRIIHGIIVCQFEDLEAALKDGRLARAIAVGVKSAQLLNGFITIMDELMKGLLDAKDAEVIKALLRWSVSSTDDQLPSELLGSKDSMDVDHLHEIVQESLEEYVEFLIVKSTDEEDIKIQVNSSSEVVKVKNENDSATMKPLEDLSTQSRTTVENRVTPSIFMPTSNNQLISSAAIEISPSATQKPGLNNNFITKIPTTTSGIQLVFVDEDPPEVTKNPSEYLGYLLGNSSNSESTTSSIVNDGIYITKKNDSYEYSTQKNIPVISNEIESPDTVNINVGSSVFEYGEKEDENYRDPVYTYVDYTYKDGDKYTKEESGPSGIKDDYDYDYENKAVDVYGETSYEEYNGDSYKETKEEYGGSGLKVEYEEKNNQKYTYDNETSYKESTSEPFGYKETKQEYETAGSKGKPEDSTGEYGEASIDSYESGYIINGSSQVSHFKEVSPEDTETKVEQTESGYEEQKVKDDNYTAVDHADNGTRIEVFKEKFEEESGESTIANITNIDKVFSVNKPNQSTTNVVQNNRINDTLVNSGSLNEIKDKNSTDKLETAEYNTTPNTDSSTSKDLINTYDLFFEEKELPEEYNPINMSTVNLKKLLFPDLET